MDGQKDIHFGRKLILTNVPDRLLQGVPRNFGHFVFLKFLNLPEA
jgi:hypothetical protein